MSNKENKITREAFVNIVNAIIAFDKMQLSFANDMDKYLDGHFVTDFGSQFSSTVLESLERCFAFGQPNDTYSGGIISWWLWDAPDAGKNVESACIGSDRIDGMWYSLATPELLYEYLTTGQTSVLTVYVPKENTIPSNFGK
jgi:hypothetical protein